MQSLGKGDDSGSDVSLVWFKYTSLVLGNLLTTHHAKQINHRNYDREKNRMRGRFDGRSGAEEKQFDGSYLMTCILASWNSIRSVIGHTAPSWKFLIIGDGFYPSKWF